MAPAPLDLSALTTLAEGVDHPEGICTTPDGTIYVGGEAGQIYRVGPDGAAEEILSTGGFLLGLAADAAGRVYAIDNVRKCVWRVDPERADDWRCGPKGRPERPFRTPNWGAFDDAGTYYLTDSGGWGTNDGLLWRIPRGGAPEVWTEEVARLPERPLPLARRLEALRARELPGGAGRGADPARRLPPAHAASSATSTRPSPTASRRRRTAAS